MAKDFIYSDDEQVIRRYSVFEAKGANPKKKGVTIIVTNKRVISTAYQNGVLSNATKNKEVLIENISGDIMTSINRKVNLFKIILFGILALFLLISGGIIGIVLGLIMIALFVLSIVFPTTEGKIEIANKGMIYNGIYAAGGRIIRGRDIFSITDITEGRDFKLMQREIGFLISEIKKGTDASKLMAMPQKRSRNDYDTQRNNYSNKNYYIEETRDRNDDDDEIPLI